MAYIKESELLKGAGLRRGLGRRAEEGFPLLCVWVIGPHQAGRFLVISQAVCGCPFATCVAAFLDLSHSQLRLIRDLSITACTGPAHARPHPGAVQPHTHTPCK